MKHRPLRGHQLVNTLSSKVVGNCGDGTLLDYELFMSDGENVWIVDSILFNAKYKVVIFIPPESGMNLSQKELVDAAVESGNLTKCILEKER